MASITTRATKGSALTWTEADNNITNLNTAKIENVVEDTSPQLGGDLDVNGKNITSASNGNVNITPNGSGNISLAPASGKIILGALDFPTGMGTNGQVLTTNGSSAMSWSTISSGGISNVVEDTTPQLGGALDVNGQQIVSASNGNIAIVPNGSGNIQLTPATGKITLGAVDWPTTGGTNGQVLTTNGTGSASWTTISSGATNLDGLSDVVITAAATNDVLVYNGTNWVDTAASTLTVSAASTATTATGATNINISTTTGNSNDTTLYPVMVGANGTGNQPPHIDTSGLSFNALANALTLGSSSSTTGASIVLFDGSAGGGGSVTLSAGANTGSDKTITFPTTTGSNNNLLGTSGSGQLTWVSAINNVSIGATTASTGRFTTVTSTIATGTAPFTVASTTNVANLNASSLSGATFAAPGAIGSTTASTGAFTTISATGAITSTLATGTAPFTVTSTTKVTNLNVEQVDGYHADTANTVSTIAVRDGSGIITASGFAGALNGTVGATTPSTGAFTTLTAATTTLDDIRETVFALTYGATITPDAANGSVQTITLTGNVTFSAFANPVSGQTITLIITQDATGSRTLTSTMKFAGGSKTLSTAANSIDILTVSYIGTTYYASLAKAFA